MGVNTFALSCRHMVQERTLLVVCLCSYTSTAPAAAKAANVKAWQGSQQRVLQKGCASVSPV